MQEPRRPKGQRPSKWRLRHSVAQANGDSSEQQKIAESVSGALKPGSARRFGKLDSRQHAIHFVEQTGNVEEECTEHRPQVGSVSKGDSRQDRNGYALKFSDDNDEQDGLFSSENGEQPVSPHDALIISAGVQNGTGTSHNPVAFNGYYLRILTSQGKNAVGGAKSYLVNGKMVSGFAFVAYPAIYRSTGVMSFIVNQNGIVYQKDLGPDTDKIGVAMTEYDPDSTWDGVD